MDVLQCPVWVSFEDDAAPVFYSFLKYSIELSVMIENPLIFVGCTVRYQYRRIRISHYIWIADSWCHLIVLPPMVVQMHNTRDCETMQNELGKQLSSWQMRLIHWMAVACQCNSQPWKVIRLQIISSYQIISSGFHYSQLLQSDFLIP